jgi:hypothetical protein
MPDVAFAWQSEPTGRDGSQPARMPKQRPITWPVDCPRQGLLVVEGAHEEFPQLMAGSYPRSARQLSEGVRPQQDVRVRPVLDNIHGCYEDRHPHACRVVDCGRQIDVLAQDDDRFLARPPVGDLVDVARNSDATRCVHHLLFYCAAGLAVKLAEKNLTPVSKNTPLILQVSGVLTTEVSLVPLARESKTDVDPRYLEAVAAESGSHSRNPGAGTDTDRISGLVKHVAAVNNHRRRNSHFRHPPLIDLTTQHTFGRCSEMFGKTLMKSGNHRSKSGY